MTQHRAAETSKRFLLCHQLPFLRGKSCAAPLCASVYSSVKWAHWAAER